MAATTAPSTQPSATQPAPARVHVIIHGRVQGVGFRAFTQAQATKLSLRGYVLNRDDGTVEAVIEGPSDRVQRLLQILRRGPESARVDKLDIVQQPFRGQFKRFEIRSQPPPDP